MASATPDLQLPSQLQDITAKLYCLVSEARVCVTVRKQLAQGRYVERRRLES